MLGVYKFRKVFFLFVLSVLFLGVFWGRANAANQDLTVSPPSFNLVVQPGQTYSGSFEVINQGSETYHFIVYSEPYSVVGETYSPDFEPVSGTPDISSWFKFSTTDKTLIPGQSTNIGYSISVPPKTLSEGYYAVAFAQTENPQADVQGVTINERVGSLFFLQVGGNVVKKGSLLSWSSSFLQKPPLSSTLKIEDNGSIHFIAKYSYKVSDIFGSAKFVINGEKILLPQTIRQISLVWQKSPSFGLYKVNGSVSFLNQTHNLDTKYVLVMSTNAKVYSLVFIVCLLVIFILFTTIKRRRNKHKK